MKKTEKHYQGYYAYLIPNKEKIKDLVELESSYTFYFHFNKSKNWGGKVIDFGGGIGQKTRYIENVTVIDVDALARRWMRKNGVKHASNIEEIADGSADTIYAAHVLEHLDNPHEMLGVFRRKLKRGGKLILVLPAENQFFEPIEPVIDSNGHISGFNFMHIFTALNFAGFRPMQYRFYPHIWLIQRIYTYLVKKRVRFVNVHELYYKLMDNKMFRLASFIANSLRPIVASILIVAVKSRKIGCVAGEYVVLSEKI